MVHPALTRRFGVLVALVMAVVAMPMAPRPALAAMPGEQVLTAAQQAEALAGMTPQEGAHLSKIWSDPANLPVAYTRALFEVTSDSAGHTVVRPVGGYDVTSGALRLPNTLTAASSGTGGAYNLYISIAVWRTSASGVYEWGTENYFKWTGAPPDACNSVEESFGTSWAGDLYLNSDNWTGWYYLDTVDTVPMYRSDFTANEGVGWSFNEYHLWPRPDACDYVYQGRAAAYIREPSWQNRTDNVGIKYAHTKGGTPSYSLSFLNASISVNPNDSNQWSATAYASFSH